MSAVDLPEQLGRAEDADTTYVHPPTCRLCMDCRDKLAGGVCIDPACRCHRVSMLNHTEPPSCLAGGVTTRADVAPLDEPVDPEDLPVSDPRRQRYEDERSMAWWAANIE